MPLKVYHNKIQFTWTSIELYFDIISSCVLVLIVYGEARAHMGLCKCAIQLFICLGLSDSRYRPELCQKSDFFSEKEDERIFAYVLEFMCTLAKMQNNSTFMLKRSKSEAGAF